MVVGGRGRTTGDAGNGSAGNGARLWVVDDADGVPKVVGSNGRGWSDDSNGGVAANQAGRRVMTGQPLPPAAATTIATMAMLTVPIAEQDRTTHHWTMVGGRGSGGWVDNDVLI